MRIFSFIFLLLASSVAYSQTQSFCSPDEKQAYTYSLKLNIPSGNTNIFPVTNPCLVKVKENGTGNAKGEYTDRVADHDMKIGFTIPKASSSPKNDWDVYLSTIKTNRLHGRFGSGRIDLNLSGLALETVDIATAKADVDLKLQKGMPNRVTMDSLILKTDMGHIKTQNLDLLKARTIMANVPFGSMILHFGAQPTVTTNVWVGTGTSTVEIILPADNTPVKIVVNQTALADLVIPPGFKEKDGKYYSPSYVEGARNAIIFHIDNSIGKVIFKVVK